jgi:hypothetical protein
MGLGEGHGGMAQLDAMRHFSCLSCRKYIIKRLSKEHHISDGSNHVSANAKQILGDIIEQQRAETMPEVSLQDYFEIFSAEQVLKDFSPTFEELEQGIVDGEHDGGVDSVFTYVNGELIREDSDLSIFKKNVTIELNIIQSKTAGGWSEDPVNRLITSLGKLLDLTADYNNLTQYNKNVLTNFDIFRHAYRNLASKYPKLKISFYYAAMRADSDVPENLRRKGDDLISLIQGMFDEAQMKFTFLAAKDLLTLARRQPNKTFELIASKALSGDNGYVLLSKLKDFNTFLRDNSTTVRHDLFESNVRDYQGSTEVNEEISTTLTSNSDVDFWWLNNGVTILASQATLAGNVITIENPQIVNGLQTSSQIAKYFDDDGSDDDRLLMIKVVSSEDESVRDQIIKATNSQNTVPRASLRATDKVQRDIEHVLKMSGYFYDRRKNYYKNQGKAANKIVSIPLLAQAMMTLLRGEPDNARARPSSLIKEDSVYSELFSENYPIDCFYVAADLIKRTEAGLKARSEFAARDRNNLRFYCLYWAAAWCAKSKKLNPKKLADIKGKVTDADIEGAIDCVSTYFFEQGGTDQLAKGSEFKKTLESEVQKKILAHFTKSDPAT